MGKNVQIGQPAPDFSLTDTDGHLFRLADFKNISNVLLVFNRGFM